MAGDKPVDINWDNLDELLGGKKPVFIDFWAPWCGPCQIMLPILDEMATSYKNREKVIIGKVNIDENPGIAGKYNVMSVPTFLFLKDGKAVNQMLGVTSKEDLEKALDKLVE